MKKQLALALGLLMVVAVVSGCGKSTKPASPSGSAVSGSAVDIAQVNDQLAANPGFVNEDLYADASPMALDGGQGFAAIRALRWWRQVDDASRTTETQFGDPDSLGRPHSAVVTITRHFTGTFNILYGDTTATDTSFKVVHKPLSDTWVRKIALHRWRFPEDTTEGRGGWRIVGTSGVQVTSDNATTHIQSIRIQAGALDTTITDPLELHRLRRVVCMPPLTDVHVTVTTGRNDDVVVLYSGMGRRKFVNNGDGTYSMGFREIDFGGLHHFGVNAFSHGTLYDTEAAYDSQAWLVPFAARPWDSEIGPH